MKKPDAKTKSRLLILLLAGILVLLAFTPLVPEAEIASCMMVTALGIDAEEDGVTLTAVMTGGSGEENVHGEGGNVTDALADMNERYGRTAEFGHCGAIVLGAEMSASDILPALESLLSSSEVNAGCAVLSAGGRADEFMRSAVKLGSGSGVTDYMGFADDGAPVPVPTALGVLTALAGKSRAAALPVFSVSESSDESGGQPSGNSGSDDSGASAQEGEKTELAPPRVCRAIGGGITELTEDATYGLMLMSPRGKGGLIDAVWEHDGESIPLLGEITGKSASLEVSPGSPDVSMRLNLTVRFADRYSVIERTGGENVIRMIAPEIAEAFAASAERKLAAAAEAARSEDVLGVRTEFYRSHPKEYKEFERNGASIAGAVFGYDVNVKIS